VIGSGRNRCAFLTIVLGVVVLAASACSPPSPAVVPVTALPARPVVAVGLRPTKVLVVTEENHTAASALHHMPYLAALSREYGQTSNYRAVSHPSLPNYRAIAAGSTFDVSDDSAPARHHLHGPSVFDSALTAGATAKIYADAMASPCALDPSGRYAVKHNAWAYFSDPPPAATASASTYRPVPPVPGRCAATSTQGCCPRWANSSRTCATTAMTAPSARPMTGCAYGCP